MGEELSAIGFKEWANVCEALGTGATALILRKGGIHEGRGGFEFKHRAFHLFPTWFHTQNEQLTWQPKRPEDYVFGPEAERKSVEICYYAELQAVWRVTEWSKMEALSPHHVWSESVVQERFAYDEESCLNVALIRAYALPSEWSFPFERKYGGCRSWVDLPQHSWGPSDLRVAMPDEAFASIEQTVRSILD
jgi:hypothetical protein